jgi:hypothetical protein
MACHEIGALRLALMNLLGGDRAAERRHEEAEIGAALDRQGPIGSLARARNFEEARVLLASAIVELEEAVAASPAGDRSLPYRRTLLVAAKSAEATFARLAEDLEQFLKSLEDAHDLIHELYPPEEG